MSVGNLDPSVRSGAKGATTPMTITGTSAGTDHAALDVTIRATDGSTPTVEVAGSYATGLDPTDVGVTVNARAHQNWPSSGRSGVSGDNQFYSQNMNDLGDLLCSLGSITSVAGSVQIDCNTGAASNGTLRVILASDQTPVPVDDGGSSISVDGDLGERRLSTSSLSNVSASASSVQLIASNSNRRALLLYNDSSEACYVKFGTTASTTSFTLKLAANTLYEVKAPCYTGRIDGIWGSATGDMRITELSL